MSSEAAELAIARLANYRHATDDEVQRSIIKTVQDMARHDPNPHALGPPATVSVTSAPKVTNGVSLETAQPPIERGTGWRTSPELRPPPGAEPGGMIDRMVEAHLGPVVRKPKAKPQEPQEPPAEPTKG